MLPRDDAQVLWGSALGIVMPTEEVGGDDVHDDILGELFDDAIGDEHVVRETSVAMGKTASRCGHACGVAKRAINDSKGSATGYSYTIWHDP